jgi:hypothetical protein
MIEWMTASTGRDIYIPSGQASGTLFRWQQISVVMDSSRMSLLPLSPRYLLLHPRLLFSQTTATDQGDGSRQKVANIQHGQTIMFERHVEVRVTALP